MNCKLVGNMEIQMNWFTNEKLDTDDSCRVFFNV